MSLTFVVGTASDVFGGDLARAVEGELRKRFPALAAYDHDEAYRSDFVEASGWPKLQQRAATLLGKGAIPHLVSVEAYQAVYVPVELANVEHVPIPNAADPLQVGSLDALVGELRAFADAAMLPTDEIELMQLAAKYLEDDDLFDQDLDVQTYVQLMLSAKQALARRQGLWVVT